GLERVRAHTRLQRAAFDQLFAALDAAEDRVELHGVPACGAGAGWPPASSSSSSLSSPMPRRASCRRVACMPAWSKNTETRHAAKPVTPRLSAAQSANDTSQDTPSECSSAISAPIASSQAEAPNTIATATH